MRAFKQALKKALKIHLIVVFVWYNCALAFPRYTKSLGPIDATPITTSPYTMVESDCGRVLYNNINGNLEVDLIAIPTNCLVCFYNEHATAGTITVDPNGSDTIKLSGGVKSAGEAVILETGVDKNFCLHGISASTWKVLLGNGTVTEETP